MSTNLEFLGRQIEVSNRQGEHYLPARNKKIKEQIEKTNRPPEQADDEILVKYYTHKNKGKSYHLICE